MNVIIPDMVCCLLLAFCMYLIPGHVYEIERSVLVLSYTLAITFVRSVLGGLELNIWQYSFLGLKFTIVTNCSLSIVDLSIIVKSCPNFIRVSHLNQIR